jgi:hypothetical protein
MCKHHISMSYLSLLTVAVLTTVLGPRAPVSRFMTGRLHEILAILFFRDGTDVVPRCVLWLFCEPALDGFMHCSLKVCRRGLTFWCWRVVEGARYEKQIGRDFGMDNVFVEVACGSESGVKVVMHLVEASIRLGGRGQVKVECCALQAFATIRDFALGGVVHVSLLLIWKIGLPVVHSQV